MGSDIRPGGETGQEGLPGNQEVTLEDVLMGTLQEICDRDFGPGHMVTGWIAGVATLDSDGDKLEHALYDSDTSWAMSLGLAKVLELDLQDQYTKTIGD
jgi:hypothetical protein